LDPKQAADQELIDAIASNMRDATSIVISEVAGGEQGIRCQPPATDAVKNLAAGRMAALGWISGVVTSSPRPDHKVDVLGAARLRATILCYVQYSKLAEYSNNGRSNLGHQLGQRKMS
jgi:hypothetical protein